MMKTFQRLGKALMLPVATLPLAGLMLGVGYWIDPVGWGSESVIAAALVSGGAAILDNMGILFAIGLGFGMTDDNDGTGALAALVSFLMFITLLSPGKVVQFIGYAPGQVEELVDGVLKIVDKSAVEMFQLTDVVAYTAFDKMNNGNVFAGIIAGIIGSTCYNKFKNVQLPAALSFFSGRRCVAIVTGFVSMLVAMVLVYVWPVIFQALFSFGESVVGLGAVGAGLYGFFNRLLIPTGLHHALNNVFWFDLAGINDLGNFWAGTGVTGETGMYMSGFFPIMMFGLPGAAFAMYKNAKPARKKAVGSLLGAAAICTFITGATEPIEFAFMFLSPILFVVHAILTGLSVGLVAFLPVRAGFNFSGGFIDLLLSSSTPHAVNPWLLIPIGLVFGALYFLIFNFMIKKFNLKTPGREEDSEIEDMGATLASNDYPAIAKVLLEGLGGASNIVTIGHCTTRLRLEVKDQALVSEKIIKSAGVSGVIRPSKTDVQIVIGTHVQFVCDELKKVYSTNA